MLPPELFHELRPGSDDAEKLRRYWASENDELKKKVEVKTDYNSGKRYAVKTFRLEEGLPIINDDLPYSLVKASDKIDAWSLGVLAFHMLTEEPLAVVTRDDDFASGSGMGFI